MMDALAEKLWAEELKYKISPAWSDITCEEHAGPRHQGSHSQTTL